MKRAVVVIQDISWSTGNKVVLLGYMKNWQGNALPVSSKLCMRRFRGGVSWQRDQSAYIDINIHIGF